MGGREGGEREEGGREGEERITNMNELLAENLEAQEGRKVGSQTGS